MSDSELWAAFRSPRPTEALSGVVRQWKACGLSQADAEVRLTAFLAEVGEDPSLVDDPIRDVLDFVVGFCSPHARLFP